MALPSLSLPAGVVSRRGVPLSPPFPYAAMPYSQAMHMFPPLSSGATALPLAQAASAGSGLHPSATHDAPPSIPAGLGHAASAPPFPFSGYPGMVPHPAMLAFAPSPFLMPATPELPAHMMTPLFPPSTSPVSPYGNPHSAPLPSHSLDSVHAAQLPAVQPCASSVRPPAGRDWSSSSDSDQPSARRRRTRQDITQPEAMGPAEQSPDTAAEEAKAGTRSPPAAAAGDKRHEYDEEDGDEDDDSDGVDDNVGVGDGIGDVRGDDSDGDGDGAGGEDVELDAEARLADAAAEGRHAAAEHAPPGLLRFLDLGLALQLLGLWFVFTQGGDAARVRSGALIAAIIYLWRVGVLAEIWGAVTSYCCCGCCARGRQNDGDGGRDDAGAAGAGGAAVEAGTAGARPPLARGCCADVAAAVAEFFMSALPMWTAPQPQPEAQEDAMRQAAG